MRFILATVLTLLILTDASAIGRRRFRTNQNCETCQPATSYGFTTAPIASSDSITPGDVFGAALLEMHNRVRANAGLAPLTMDAGLTSEATASAAEQYRRRSIGHFLPLLGARENSAQGASGEADCHRIWFNSPGHRAAIMGPYTRVGFGRVGEFWAARYR